ncbi:unnamed protein product [Gadus morhua 'NCC']
MSGGSQARQRSDVLVTDCLQPTVSIAKTPPPYTHMYLANWDITVISSGRATCSTAPGSMARLNTRLVFDPPSDPCFTQGAHLALTDSQTLSQEGGMLVACSVINPDI